MSTRKHRDYKGLRIGKVTVLERVYDQRVYVLATGEETKKPPRWRVRCDCGEEWLVLSTNISERYPASCAGCANHKHKLKLPRTKGLVKREHASYGSWYSMIRRCTHKNYKSYEDYGGRGIRVCARWFDFSNFVADMGIRPPLHTIDRIDNDGNYEPGNCKWSTAKEQRANCRPPKSRKHIR